MRKKRWKSKPVFYISTFRPNFQGFGITYRRPIWTANKLFTNIYYIYTHRFFFSFRMIFFDFWGVLHSTFFLLFFALFILFSDPFSNHLLYPATEYNIWNWICRFCVLITLQFIFLIFPPNIIEKTTVASNFHFFFLA